MYQASIAISHTKLLMQYTGVESELDGSHLGEVVREMNPANLKWYDIGLQLGLESYILDGIKVQCGPIPSDCFREMIKEWLKCEESNWIKLQDALRSPTVREFKLAGLLQRKHSSQSDEQAGRYNQDGREAYPPPPHTHTHTHTH